VALPSWGTPATGSAFGGRNPQSPRWRLRASIERHLFLRTSSVPFNRVPADQLSANDVDIGVIGRQRHTTDCLERQNICLKIGITQLGVKVIVLKLNG